MRILLTKKKMIYLFVFSTFNRFLKEKNLDHLIKVYSSIYQFLLLSSVFQTN